MSVHLEQVHLLVYSLDRLKGYVNLTIQDLVNLLDDDTIQLLKRILEHSENNYPLAFYQKHRARIFVGDVLPNNLRGQFIYNAFLGLYLEDNKAFKQEVKRTLIKSFEQEEINFIEEKIKQLALLPNLYKKHILITGGTGYIGGKLIERLQKEYTHSTLYVLIHKNTEFSVKTVDTRKVKCIHYAEIGDYKFDYIFHIGALANQYKEDVDYIEDLVNSNLMLSLNLYHYARRTDTPILFISSYSQYIQKDPYCITKQTVEDLVNSIASFKKYTFVRLTDVYGEDDTRNKVFNLMKRATQDKGMIKLKSAENKPYNVTHIDFITEALVYIMEKALTGTYDLIYPSTLTTLGEVARQIDPSMKHIHFTQESTEETGQYLVPLDKHRLKGFKEPNRVQFNRKGGDVNNDEEKR